MQNWKVEEVLELLTNLKSFPSNFLAFVNTTVLAGMLRPRANVSVAKRAWKEQSQSTTTKLQDSIFCLQGIRIYLLWLNLLRREFQWSPLKLEEVQSDEYQYHALAREEHAPPKIESNALFWADIVCNLFPDQGIAWRASKFAHECINYCMVLQIKETSIIMLLYWNIYFFFTWGRVLSSSDKQSIALLNTSSTNFFSWPRKGKELHV